MRKIFNLDLFKYMNEYTDLRRLCDTCLSFKNFKKYVHYNLNKQYSLLYYDNAWFRNIVLSKIVNSKQLHLDLISCVIVDKARIN
jgi:hypothetical protein